MRRNIFIKSTIRRPVRSLLLAVLIAASSFAVVSRFVEYIVVSEQIHTISNFFQSTGVLTSLDGDITADVREAADLIESSDFVVFGDRRRGFEGLLTEIQNSSVHGEHHWLAAAYFVNPAGPVLSEDPARFFRDGIDFDLITHPFMFTKYPGFARYESGDAFFSGSLVDIYYTTALNPEYHHMSIMWMGDSWFAPNVNLVVRVDNVLAGYYDHISSGAYVILRYHLIDGEHPFNDLEIGGRYFFKGTHYNILGTGLPPFSREEGIDNPQRRNVLFSQPLNDEGLFYISLTDEMPDFDALGLSHIYEEIIFTNHVQRSVYIRTTRDMTSIDTDAISVFSGRLPNFEDYTEARQVAAIHRVFANRRGLDIGDTIKIEFNREQHMVESDFFFVRWEGSYFGTFRDLLILSNPLANPGYELELEVIGIYDMYEREWPTRHHSSIPRTIFIPDSLLPGLYVLTSPRGELTQDYIPAIWYSFVLRDSRYVDSFIESYGSILEEMGFHLSFRDANSANFWISANITLQSMAINLVLFTILLILTLMLSAYFVISQRRRDFAVLQALGLPTKSIKTQFILVNMALWIPAIIVGSRLGWNYSIEMAMGTLRPFAEMLVDSLNVWPWLREGTIASFLSAALPPTSLLVLMCMVVIIAVFILLIGGLRILLRYPVLEQLQGRQAAKIIKTKVRKDNITLDNFVHTTSGDNSELSFIIFHILRSPLRTVLSLLVALIFVLSLGLLSETIYQAGNEIDRLYDTTTVYAEVIWDPEDPSRDNPRIMRDMIPRHNFINIFNRDFINEYFIEANNGAISLLLPQNEFGDFPHDLLSVARLDENSELNMGTGGIMQQIFNYFDMLFATNELRFFTENPTGFIGRFAGTPQTMQNMEVFWAEGFDETRFEYQENEPIPVIISQRIANAGMIGLGDEIFIAYTNSIDHLWYLGMASQVQHGLRDQMTLEMPRWYYVEAIVIGMHNSKAVMDLHMHAAIVPLAALESLYGSALGYETLRFEIDTSFNRDLQTVNEILAQTVIFLPRDWWNQLTVVVHDRELMFVVIPMEENLALLQLLFPIAIILSTLMGAGIHILLMLQNAKNAAIMTVLGTSRRKTKLMLGFQLMLVSICGAVTAILILIISVNIRFDLIISALPFLTGSVAGTIIGAELTTNKAPLELLQVKE